MGPCPQGAIFSAPGTPYPLAPVTCRRPGQQREERSDLPQCGCLSSRSTAKAVEGPRPSCLPRQTALRRTFRPALLRSSSSGPSHSVIVIICSQAIDFGLQVSEGAVNYAASGILEPQLRVRRCRRPPHSICAAGRRVCGWSSFTSLTSTGIVDSVSSCAYRRGAICPTTTTGRALVRQRCCSAPWFGHAWIFFDQVAASSGRNTSSVRWVCYACCYIDLRAPVRRG
jgi:hypothetical protein